MNMRKVRTLARNEKGVAAVEYALIVALISVACIGALQGVGNKLNTTFNSVSNALN
jgi:pilus assembly protein Flp/PilA